MNFICLLFCSVEVSIPPPRSDLDGFDRRRRRRLESEADREFAAAFSFSLCYDPPFRSRESAQEQTAVLRESDSTDDARARAFALEPKDLAGLEIGTP